MPYAAARSGESDASLFRRCGGDWDLARLGLVAHARSANFGFLGFLARHLGRFFPILISRAVPLLAAALMAVHLALVVALNAPLAAALVASLTLLRRGLIHQVQHAKIVFGVLQVAFRHDAVAAACGIAAKLQIFLEQLLRHAANTDVRAIAVEYVVAVQRDPARHVVSHPAATTASATTSAATPARAMVAATHAFHVHTVAVVLSRCVAA